MTARQPVPARQHHWAVARRLRLFVVLLGIVVSVSCSSEAPAGPSGAVAGTSLLDHGFQTGEGTIYFEPGVRVSWVDGTIETRDAIVIDDVAIARLPDGALHLESHLTPIRHWRVSGRVTPLPSYSHTGCSYEGDPSRGPWMRLAPGTELEAGEEFRMVHFIDTVGMPPGDYGQVGGVELRYHLKGDQTPRVQIVTKYTFGLKLVDEEEPLPCDKIDGWFTQPDEEPDDAETLVQGP